MSTQNIQRYRGIDTWPGGRKENVKNRQQEQQTASIAAPALEVTALGSRALINREGGTSYAVMLAKSKGFDALLLLKDTRKTLATKGGPKEIECLTTQVISTNGRPRGTIHRGVQIPGMALPLTILFPPPPPRILLPLPSALGQEQQIALLQHIALVRGQQLALAQQRQDVIQIGIHNQNSTGFNSQRFNNVAAIDAGKVSPKVPTVVTTSTSASTANNTATHPNASAFTTQSTINVQQQLALVQQMMQNRARIGIHNQNSTGFNSQRFNNVAAIDAGKVRPKVPTMATTSTSVSTANNTATHPNASASTTQSTTNVQQQMMQNTTQININKNTQNQDPQQSNQQQRAPGVFTPPPPKLLDGISESTHDTLLENKPYHYGSMKSREAEALLENKPPHTFLVRPCTDPNERVNGDLNPNLFILTFVARSKCKHAKIWRYVKEKGLGLKRDPNQTTTVFKSISQMIHSRLSSEARPVNEYLRRG